MLIFLSNAASESIDMIFADSPYMLSNRGITCHAGKVVSVNKGKWDESKEINEDFEFHNKWIKACKRVLKPNRTIWISETYHSIYVCGFALQVNAHFINYPEGNIQTRFLNCTRKSVQKALY